MNSAFRVAAVTMVYNEAVMLPRWTSYYERQVGVSSCYVVDHGSTDASTDFLSCNRIQIPRSAMDDVKRAKFVSAFCSSLLEWYDAVMYTDVDEFLVPDPSEYDSIPQFCQSMRAPVTTAVGLNVQHVIGLDKDLRSDEPILRQRRWVRFALAMCKPLITRVPISWGAGFHISNHPTVFDGLFLFHLHHSDLNVALDRLDKTRNMPWANEKAGHHQRMSNEQYTDMLKSIAGLERKSDTTFARDDSQLNRYVNYVLEYMKEPSNDRRHFYMTGEVTSNELLYIPERFVNSF